MCRVGWSVPRGPGGRSASVLGMHAPGVLHVNIPAEVEWSSCAKVRKDPDSGRERRKEEMAEAEVRSCLWAITPCFGPWEASAVSSVAESPDSQSYHEGTEYFIFLGD